MDPKNVLKAPLAPTYNNFEGGARAEKTQFLVEIFQRVHKKAFLTCFFKILVKTGTKQCFGRARKINLADLKKGRQIFFLIRLPPLEKILYPPLYQTMLFLQCGQNSTVLWESSKNQFGRPKKRSTNFFFNPPPPSRENPRSSSVSDYALSSMWSKFHYALVPSTLD